MRFLPKRQYEVLFAKSNQVRIFRHGELRRSEMTVRTFTVVYRPIRKYTIITQCRFFLYSFLLYDHQSDQSYVSYV